MQSIEQIIMSRRGFVSKSLLGSLAVATGQAAFNIPAVCGATLSQIVGPQPSPLPYGSAGSMGGSIVFLDDDGNPLLLTVNGVSGVKSFDYDYPGNLTFLITKETPEKIWTGSALITSNAGGLGYFAQIAAGGDYQMLLQMAPAEEGVSGQLTFYRFDLSHGGLIGYASVLPDVPRHISTFPFTPYTPGSDQQQTGFAITNPSETDAQALISAHFKDGQVVSRQLALGPRGHKALFLDELLGPLPSEGMAQVVGTNDLVVLAINMYQGQLSTGQVTNGKLQEAFPAYKVADLLCDGTNFSDPRPRPVPVVGATVRMEYADTGKVYSFPASPDGNVDFSDLEEPLPDGTYHRTVEAQGFVTMHQDVEFVDGDTPETIYLVPRFTAEGRPGVVPELLEGYYIEGQSKPIGGWWNMGRKELSQRNCFAATEQPWRAYMVRSGLDFFEGEYAEDNMLAFNTFNQFVTHEMPAFGIPVAGPAELVEHLPAGVSVDDPYTFIVTRANQELRAMIVGGLIDEAGRILSGHAMVSKYSTLIGTANLARELPWVFGVEDNEMTIERMAEYGVSVAHSVNFDIFNLNKGLNSTPFDRVNYLIKRSLPRLTLVSKAQYWLPQKVDGAIDYASASLRSVLPENESTVLAGNLGRPENRVRVWRVEKEVPYRPEINL